MLAPTAYISARYLPLGRGGGGGGGGMMGSFAILFPLLACLVSIDTSNAFFLLVHNIYCTSVRAISVILF